MKKNFCTIFLCFDIFFCLRFKFDNASICAVFSRKFQFLAQFYHSFDRLLMNFYLKLSPFRSEREFIFYFLSSYFRPILFLSLSLDSLRKTSRQRQQSQRREITIITNFFQISQKIPSISRKTATLKRIFFEMQIFLTFTLGLF